MGFSIIGKSLAGLLFAVLLSLPVAAADIVLQSALSHANVTLRNGTLVAGGNPRDAMRFEIVRLEGRRIALRAPDGTYMRAGIGPHTMLGIGSPHIRGWETFEMESQGGDTVSLRSVQNGKFVTINDQGQLFAVAERRGSFTQFRVISVPERPRPARPEAPAFSWNGVWNQIWLAGVDGRGVPAPREARPRFVIDRDMAVSFTAGCNTLNTRMDLRGRNVTFAPAMMTRMSCNSASQVYEQHVASALRAVRSWEYREGQIAFLDASGRRILQIGR